MSARPDLPDVFSADEIARAAGVRPRDVRDLAASGIIQPVSGRFFSPADAVFAVRSLSALASPADRTIFRPVAGLQREPGLPIAVAGTLHAAMLAGLVLATLGVAKPEAVAPQDRKEMRLVFLVAPGPGGGGGGGGHLEPAPPPPAARKGVSALRSPLPVRRPPPRVDPPPIIRPVEPPPVKAEPLPPIVAPVVPVAADPRDRAGIPWTKEAPQETESHGPGAGGGTGTGRGTGLGEGDGAGIGAGSGGGTGGGPYRPGSGITAPAIIKEVKPDYTEEGRRRNLEGDVVFEIVVRSDGTVGNVKLLHGLGAGLDQRASEALRQWRFSPARRLGVPVDVIVEVAMEFKLR
jgi:periplasmic protein TonB